MPVAKMTPLKDIKAVQNWSLQFAMMAAFLSAIGLYSPLINMVNILADGLRKFQRIFPMEVGISRGYIHPKFRTYFVWIGHQNIQKANFYDYCHLLLMPKIHQFLSNFLYFHSTIGIGWILRQAKPTIDLLDIPSPHEGNSLPITETWCWFFVKNLKQYRF